MTCHNRYAAAAIRQAERNGIYVLYCKHTAVEAVLLEEPLKSSDFQTHVAKHV